MPRRWRRVATAVVGILLMGGLQQLISSTPTGLVPISGSADAGYRLERTDGRYTLTLYGEAAEAPPRDLSIVGIAAAAEADPVRPPDAALSTSEQPSRRVVLDIDADPGTYKLRLPGFRPFGLLNARG